MILTPTLVIPRDAKQAMPAITAMNSQEFCFPESVNPQSLMEIWAAQISRRFRSASKADRTRPMPVSEASFSIKKEGARTLSV
jgi:hypothetical protein